MLDTLTPTDYVIIALVVIAGIIFAKGLKIIRPTHVAAIETLGKNTGFRRQGITYVIPFVQQIYRTNRTEVLVDVEKQNVITADNLNCDIDCQIYYKIKDDDDSLRKVFYEVRNYERQIVNLAQTTLRNVIGKYNFQKVNSERAVLNTSIFETIQKEADSWGINIVRCEVKAIIPPPDVQESMNRIIIADNRKTAAVNDAIAAKTEARGQKDAQIELAEAEKQTLIKKGEAEKEFHVRVAEGKAKAIEMIAEAKGKAIKVESESANNYFKENAVKYKTLETNQEALKTNTKFIIADREHTPVLVFGDKDMSALPIQVTPQKASKRVDT